MTFSKIALSGGGWTFLQTLIERGLQATVFLIVAKMLGPRDFGLSALAIALPAVWIATVQAFTQVTVQSERSDSKFLTNIFICSVASGAMSLTFTIIFAAFFSKYMREPGLFYLISIAAISPLACSFGVVSEGVLLRKFAFRALAIRRSLAILISSPICVFMAVRGMGALSIVVNTVLSTSISSIIAIISAAWLPKNALDYSEIREIFKKSSYIMTSQLIGQSNTRLCDVCIGAILGPSAAGIFRISRTIMDLMVSLLFNPVAAVLLPIFSRLSNDRDRAVSALGRVIIISAILLGAAAIAINAAGGSISLSGQAAWGNSSMLVQVMSIFLPTLAVTITSQSFLVAVGRMRESLAISFTDLIISMTFVSCGSFWGVVGAGLGFTIKSFIMAGVTFLIINACGYKFNVERNKLILSVISLNLLLCVISFPIFKIFYSVFSNHQAKIAIIFFALLSLFMYSYYAWARAKPELLSIFEAFFVKFGLRFDKFSGP